MGQGEPYHPFRLFNFERNGFMQVNPEGDLRLHVVNLFYRYHLGYGAVRVLRDEDGLLGVQMGCLNIQGHVGRLVTLMGAYLRRRARSPHHDHRRIALVFKGNVGYSRHRIVEAIRRRLRLPQGVVDPGWRVRLQLGTAPADAQGDRDNPDEQAENATGKAHAHPPSSSRRRSGSVSGSEMISFSGVT